MSRMTKAQRLEQERRHKDVVAVCIIFGVICPPLGLLMYVLLKD